MREIKFRAWNNKFKEFNFMSLVEYLGGRGILDEWVDNEHSVWEQYTGLKDKNSVEIYENDIIEITDTSYGDNGKHYGVVEYSEYAELVVGNILLSRVYKAIKIIGNIHENADLLEER